MTDRCEPPEHLRDRDGWHWLNLHGLTKPAPYRWIANEGWQEMGFKRPTDYVYRYGYRYIAPVAPNDMVRALVEALEGLMSDNAVGYAKSEARNAARAALHRAKEAGV
jgi:acyl dehydratase